MRRPQTPAKFAGYPPQWVPGIFYVSTLYYL